MKPRPCSLANTCQVAFLALLSSGCSPDAEIASPDPRLDPGLDYLASLRQAAEQQNPGARSQWQRNKNQYREFTQQRLTEIRRHPFFPLHPEYSDAQWLGWDTWFHWTAGNAFMWRDIAQRTEGRLNLLKLLDNQLIDRKQRFARFGLVNHPDAAPPAHSDDGRCRTDSYGLCLDQMPVSKDSAETLALMGRPSGVMGLRLFDNPDYRPGTWNPADPWRPPPGCTPGQRADHDPATTARQSNQDCYQPPYLVGMSCGFCHISPHPERPPEDPANPGWENLAGTLGNIYLREGPLLSWLLDEGADSFVTRYLETQPPGTSDTSRMASDDIDNPNAINAIFQLGARLSVARKELMGNGRLQAVPHVLKDGADSSGVALAALRVYVNVGLAGNYWLNLHDGYLLLGGKPRRQQRFHIDQAMVTPGYQGQYTWNQTELRMPALAAYLSGVQSFKLARAPGGTDRLTSDPDVMQRGALVFADHCAGCHSSKQPNVDRIRAPEEWTRQMRDLVLREDFLDDNFLSDDRRYPATEVGGNIARTLGSNAIAGHIWHDFSSLSYKRLPSIGTLRLEQPRGDRKRRFHAPAGGRGYYRTASLVSLWATAPFLHTNTVGRHVHDSHVDARLRAYQDAAEQLLWPERRTDEDGRPGPYIKTSGEGVSWLDVPAGPSVPIPPHYPIKMLGNLPLAALAEGLPESLSKRLTRAPSTTRKAFRQRLANSLLTDKPLRSLLRKALLRLNTAPDFVENRGHEAIVARIDSDRDKRALIEFMKTF